MEIFVAFHNAYHLLSLGFKFYVLFECSTVTFYFAVDKHYEER